MPKKSNTTAPLPQHSFRWRWGKSEIEASGLGLIPALAVVLLLIVLIVFCGATVKFGSGAFRYVVQADPIVLERPPR